MITNKDIYQIRKTLRKFRRSKDVYKRQGVNGREDNRATGIGLYLSRKILKKLGHEITVDSQVDKGTEVRLSLWKKELEMY